MSEILDKLKNNSVRKFDTKDNSLIIKFKNGFANLLFYGKKLNDNGNYNIFDCFHNDNKPATASIDDLIDFCTIITSTGDATNSEPMVSFSMPDGLFISRFRVDSVFTVNDFYTPLVKPRKIDKSICIKYTDIISGIELYQYFSFYNDSNVISTHTEIVNTSDDFITVNRLMSCQLEFYSESAKITSFDGTWLKERTPHTSIIKSGKFEIDSKIGTSSGTHNPFIIVELNDKILAFNLIYSGNHKEIVEISPYRKTKIITGMNDYNFSYRLEKNCRLVSPEAIFVCSDNMDSITREMHKFSLNHIINPTFAYNPRPVLINNWEGTGFNFTGQKILEMAKIANNIGIELFVLDDGWFGKRDSDTSGLGDWYDNYKKTGGIKKLAQNIKSLGMKFGLWVEPEMISADSDLYRNHPEYTMKIPNTTPIERRTQLMLDLVNPDVQEYIINTLINLFKDIQVDYVKWDYNRFMTDIYSHTISNQGKYFYDYSVAQVNILNKITSALPDVLFESCSAGGNRYDLAMQFFMPQNWASDNTNAFDRLTIQEGTLVAYPQSSMGAHVSYMNSLPNISLESKFNVACIGAFGYEFDITKCSECDLEIIKNQIQYYKKYRSILQYGNFYRLGGSFTESDSTGYMLVNDDKTQAVAIIFEKNISKFTRSSHFKFTGLDNNKLYSVEMRKQSNVDNVINFVAYGDALNSFGLDFGNLHLHETDRFSNSDFTSRMFYIHEIIE